MPPPPFAELTRGSSCSLVVAPARAEWNLGPAATLSVDGLDGAHELLVRFEVFVGYERLAWEEGPWLSQAGETFLIPFELPSPIADLPGIAERGGVLTAEVHIDGITATPANLFVGSTDGVLTLEMEPPDAERVVPARKRPGAEERIEARLARARQIEALPDGDTGLAEGAP